MDYQTNKIKGTRRVPAHIVDAPYNDPKTGQPRVKRHFVPATNLLDTIRVPHPTIEGEFVWINLDDFDEKKGTHKDWPAPNLKRRATRSQENDATSEVGAVPKPKPKRRIRTVKADQ